MNSRISLLVLPVVLMASGCANPNPEMPEAEAPAPIPPPAATSDNAVRASPVIAGRPARVFVMAGFGKNCEPTAAPQISIVQAPAKGDLSYVPGQQTTIQYSASGTCTGQKVEGTGIYYTARTGQLGADTFSISAKLATGEIATRTFSVNIVQ